MYYDKRGKSFSFSDCMNECLAGNTFNARYPDPAKTSGIQEKDRSSRKNSTSIKSETEENYLARYRTMPKPGNIVSLKI